MTSCAISLSGETIHASHPAASALAARVPATSSASKPGADSTGMRIAEANRRAGPIDAAMSSGIFSRCALYAG